MKSKFMNLTIRAINKAVVMGLLLPICNANALPVGRQSSTEPNMTSQSPTREDAQRCRSLLKIALFDFEFLVTTSKASIALRKQAQALAKALLKSVELEEPICQTLSDINGILSLQADKIQKMLDLDEPPDLIAVRSNPEAAVLMSLFLRLDATSSWLESATQNMSESSVGPIIVGQQKVGSSNGMVLNTGDI
jgi:hypothetical protein